MELVLRRALFCTAVTLSGLLTACDLFNPVELGDHGVFGSQFELLWDTVDREYPGFAPGDVDWDAIHEQYEPLADSVGTQLGFITLMCDMLSSFKNPCFRIIAAEGVFYPYQRDSQGNCDWQVLIENYLQPAGLTWLGENPYEIGVCLIDSIPYAVITGWYPAAWNASLLWVFADRYADAPAMILDIRLCGSEESIDDWPVGDIARTFNPVVRTGFFSVARAGDEHGDLSELVPTIVPRRTGAFQGQVAVLIGDSCRYATEEFACMVSEIPTVTLIGDTTMISCDDASPYQLMGNTFFYVPESTVVRADSISWVMQDGVAPDIAVEATEEQFAQGIDPVLEYAVEWAHSFDSRE